MSLLSNLFDQKKTDLEEAAAVADLSSELPIMAVVGLGNPGPEYEGTRHNVGFEVVERLANDRGLKWKRERKFRAKIARQGAEITFVKPHTYMNLSGQAVARLHRYLKILPQQILVVYDDVSLPIGRLRFRASGSAGGHNGIKSIIEYIGGQDFPRLKVGIGARDGDTELKSHVLGHFEQEEREEMQKSLELATDAVNYALSSGLGAAMNCFNQRSQNKKKDNN